jgi:F-type H+-transporting ATPase subunit epsilon
MANTTKLEIVTPEALIYSEEVEMVTLPSVEGQLGILPHHIRLMTQLVPGEMTVRRNGKVEYMAVGEGLLEVKGASVSVITNMAISVDKIDEAAVEEARQRAAARLSEKISSEEVAAVNASLVRSLTQLRVKRRHRR